MRSVEAYTAVKRLEFPENSSINFVSRLYLFLVGLKIEFSLLFDQRHLIDASVCFELMFTLDTDGTLNAL